MSARFNECVEVVLRHEGGFVDNPADPGGATNHGISLRYARSLGSQLDLDGNGVVDRNDIMAVTSERASTIYRNWFWHDVKGDELPAGVDLAVFDFAVNSGPSRAIKAMQKAVGTQEDGVIGPETLAKVRATPADIVIARVTDERRRFLRGLRTYPTFGRGWERRIDDVRFHALEMVGGPQTTLTEAATSQTGQSAALVATVGAVATAASQAEPALRVLGGLAPWLAVLLIAATLAGIYIWKMKKG